MKYRAQIAFGLSLPLLMPGHTSATTLEQAIKNTLNSHPQISASVNSRYSADQILRRQKAGIYPHWISPPEPAGNKRIMPPRAPQAITCVTYTAVNPVST